MSDAARLELMRSALGSEVRAIFREANIDARSVLLDGITSKGYFTRDPRPWTDPDRYWHEWPITMTVDQLVTVLTFVERMRRAARS